MSVQPESMESGESRLRLRRLRRRRRNRESDRVEVTGAVTLADLTQLFPGF